MANRVGLNISSEAVKAKTGKTWAQWFALLDKSRAQAMSHKDIVAVLAGKNGLGPWWRQMVAVAYEQAKGLRDKHEKPDGFEISRSNLRLHTHGIITPTQSADYVHLYKKSQ